MDLSKSSVVSPELLAAVDDLQPTSSLADRLRALETLARWVIETPALKRLRAPAPLQLSRVRQLVRVCMAEPERRTKLVDTLASVLRDTHAVELFSEAGMPSERGMGRETVDRIARRVLPRPPDDEDLERFVSRVFRRSRDCAWIEAAPIEVFVELGELFGDIWAPLREAMVDAIALLCTRISGLGLSADLRERSDVMHVRESPFFRLPHAPLEQLPALILECRGQLTVIHKRLETTGVSVDVVYCIDAIRRMLARIERMAPLVTGRGDALDRVGFARSLLARLTAGRIADDSLRQLVGGNLGLLARKVIERVGHTGEHYVTATRRDYFRMLLSAAGGGALTALTVVGKFLMKWQHFAPFIDGLSAALVYAGSFLAMQFLGLTLATKQPSMTAAVLAQSIRETHGEHQLDDLVMLIARISRSQFAAAVGNVCAVVPVALAVDFLWTSARGHHFFDDHDAQTTIASFDPLHTGTIFFAALTGVLLWLSSLGAGWLENWVTYRRLPEALRHHRFAKVVGQQRMNRVADFVQNQAAGIGGNTTLGLLLGLVPVLGAFFGLPLEVRHITLSTGSLAFAGAQLGWDAITVSSCIGIAVIGLMNFGVSFALALLVALRAREVSNQQRLGLAVAVLRRFLRHPFRFVFPPRDSIAAASASVTGAPKAHS